MKYYIFTLGCQMNISDSEKIAQALEDSGNILSSEQNAQLIIVNACSVRQKAVDRIWGKINNWQKSFDNQSPSGRKKIVITGCVLQSDRKKFARKGIDYIDFSKDLNSVLTSHSLSGTSYITIMTGCNNFCSYCAVPYTRGREKSKSIYSIISEIENALNAGAKNILLLGQNVNSYKYGFAKLLKKIDDLDGNFNFNFLSSNPHDMTDEIIETFSLLKKWPKELHLAMQSGDDEILKKMNRKYSSSQYLKLTKKLKLKIENLSLTTDIIVGFPGETKKQFDNTVKICKQIEFNKAYIAQYSPRPGTASAKLIDNITANEKKHRWQVLEKLIN